MVRVLVMMLIGVSLLAVVYVVKDYHNQTKITAIKTENNALNGKMFFMEKRIEKEHQDMLAISERNKELEKAAAKDKAFDWGFYIGDSPVIKRLQAD